MSQKTKFVLMQNDYDGGYEFLGIFVSHKAALAHLSFLGYPTYPDDPIQECPSNFYIEEVENFE